MGKKKTTILLICIFALFVGGAVLLYDKLTANVEPEAPPASETDAVLAPDFTALDAEGNEVKLSDMQGRPVVLNFWASWCPPCKGEMPEFDKVYAELGSDIVFMMVDMVDGSRETLELGAAFIAESGYSFPVYYDINQEAAYYYGVTSIPTTYFIDKYGYVVTGARGQINEAMLRRGIEMIQAVE